MTPLKITLILIIKLRKITNINKRTFVDKTGVGQDKRKVSLNNFCY